MTRRSECVIFDLDGTLLDTEELYSVATEIVCQRYGAHFTLELKRQIMGGDSITGARVVVDALGLPLSPQAYLDAREHELERLLPSAQPMPGAVALVTSLHALGVTLAIATSGHRHVTDLKLPSQPFLAQIPHWVCGDDPRLKRGKPAPDIYLLAADAAGVEPARCICIEDTVNGVRAGLAAGMRTFALVDPRWGVPLEQYAGAERVVRSLEELSVEALQLTV
jgi:pseudouridine-5'-monophosphatase